MGPAESEVKEESSERRVLAPSGDASPEHGVLVPFVVPPGGLDPVDPLDPVVF